MKIEQDGEVKLKKRNPANRLTALILGLILVVIIVVVAIVVVIGNIKEAQLGLYVDGQRKSFTEDTFRFMDDRAYLYIDKRYSHISWL